MISAIKARELHEESKMLKERLLQAQKEQQDAAKFGDLSENEEYHSAVRECNEISVRLAEIENLLSDNEIVTESPGPRIGIDSYVGITNVTEGIPERIMHVDSEGDTLDDTIGKCVLNVDSLLGKAILNSTGGIFKIPTKQGIIEYKVRKCPYKDIMRLQNTKS